MVSKYYEKYYSLMTRRNSRLFREECIAHFGWAENTFYNRIKGAGFAGPYEEKEFIRIMNKYLPIS